MPNDCHFPQYCEPPAIRSAPAPVVLWLSLPDSPEKIDAPLIAALQSRDAWTSDIQQASRLASLGYTVKRRDRHKDGHFIETDLTPQILETAIARNIEMRGDPTLNRPSA